MNRGVNSIVHGSMGMSAVPLLVVIGLSACAPAKDHPLVGRWDRSAPPNCHVMLVLSNTGQWRRSEGCPIDERVGGWHETNGTYAVMGSDLSMRTLQGSCTDDHRKTEVLKFSLVEDELMLTGEGHDEVLTRTGADEEIFGLATNYGCWVDDSVSPRFFIPYPLHDLEVLDAESGG
jgi:hypothetical protein